MGEGNTQSCHYLFPLRLLCSDLLSLGAAPFPQHRGHLRLAAFDQAATLPPRRFDISAGLLQDAIDIFQRTTGLQVALLNEGIGKLNANAVSGVLTPEQALNQLLKDTGVHWRFTNSNSVLLELNSVSASVDVSD